MPIRINLLAETLAAEEQKRRDPVKRVVFAGVALTALMIVWIGLTQVSVGAARGELATLTESLKRVEDSSKNVRSNQLVVADLASKIKALERYASNRFLSGNLLDAVQQAGVDNIRLVEIKVEQKHLGGDANKFLSTNIPVPFTAPAAAWKFWASRREEAPLASVVSNSFSAITNKPPFTTNLVAYTVKVSPASTNRIEKKINAKVEFSTVPWSMERTVIEVKGRDYGNPPGAAIDEFARRINSSTLFKTALEPGKGIRFTERPPQPRPDPNDTENPNALFVPFTIELALRDRLFGYE